MNKPAYQLAGIENPRTGEVHLWIKRDGHSIGMEEICCDLCSQHEEIRRLHVVLDAYSIAEACRRLGHTPADSVLKTIRDYWEDQPA